MSEPNPRQPRNKEGVEEPAPEATDAGLSKSGGGREREEEHAGGMLGEAETGHIGGMLDEAGERGGEAGGMEGEG